MHLRICLVAWGSPSAVDTPGGVFVPRSLVTSEADGASVFVSWSFVTRRVVRISLIR